MLHRPIFCIFSFSFLFRDFFLFHYFLLRPLVDLPASELINQGEDGGVEGGPSSENPAGEPARLKRVNRVSSPERWELKQMLAAKVITRKSESLVDEETF